MIKKTLLILAIIIVLLAVINFLITNKTKIIIDIEDDEKMCPEVCIEMWVLGQNTCIFNECGSGCGPDNIKTFKTEEECLMKLT